MSHAPTELKYTTTHEWVRLEDDETVTVGITDHAQELLGDMVFIETPEVDSELDAGDSCAVVESVKAASDVYCPVAGTIIDTNLKLADEPEIVNSDPYGDGWIFRLKPTDIDDIEELLAASDYEEIVASEESDDDEDLNDDE